MSLCIPYAVWLTHILDWLLSSDSAKSCPAFHADNIGKNEKAATLDSLYSLKAKKKPHCFPVAVLLTLPCCVHSIGICSLFTASMTGFKHTFLKSKLSDSEIFSTCSSLPGCWVYCSDSWEASVDRSRRQMYTGDTENETQEKCLLGRKILLEDDRITGAALPPRGRSPHIQQLGGSQCPSPLPKSHPRNFSAKKDLLLWNWTTSSGLLLSQIHPPWTWLLNYIPNWADSDLIYDMILLVYNSLNKP